MQAQQLLTSRNPFSRNRYTGRRITIGVLLFLLLFASLCYTFLDSNESSWLIESLQVTDFRSAPAYFVLKGDEKKSENAENHLANIICQKGIESVEKENVQLVAFDFDMTIIDIHTWGAWEGSSEDLSKHVRPEFQCFIRKCLERNIHVAITTYSTQKDLISSVLEKTIHVNKQIETIQTVIPIFGGGDYVRGFSKGKESQLILALDHFKSFRKHRKDAAYSSESLRPDTTVLVDDDHRNIHVAKKDNYRTIHYKPKHSESENALVIDSS